MLVSITNRITNCNKYLATVLLFTWLVLWLAGRHDVTVERTQPRCMLIQQLLGMPRPLRSGKRQHPVPIHQLSPKVDPHIAHVTRLWVWWCGYVGVGGNAYHLVCATTPTHSQVPPSP